MQRTIQFVTLRFVPAIAISFARNREADAIRGGIHCNQGRGAGCEHFDCSKDADDWVARWSDRKLLGSMVDTWTLAKRLNLRSR